MFMIVFLQNIVLTLFWLDNSYSEQNHAKNKGKMENVSIWYPPDWNRVKEKAV